MKHSMEAVFEKGVFRPIGSPSVAEGRRVHITVDDDDAQPSDLLDLAGKVYDGLSDEAIREVETIALDRSHFFTRKD